MKKEIKFTLIMFLLLSLTFAMGFFCSPPDYREVPVAVSYSRGRTIQPTKDIEHLREQIKSLAEENHALVAALAKAKLNPDVIAPIQQPAQIIEKEETPQRPQSRRERLEDLKKSDPERYAAIMKRMAEFNEQIKTSQAERQDFLASFDMNLLTPEQQKIHAEFSDAVAKRNALIEKFNPMSTEAAEPTEEQRTEMFEATQTVRELSGIARANLLNAAAVSLGLDGEDATDFVDTIDAIYNATSDRMMNKNHPPRR